MMDTFKCESCGSTNIIQKDGQTICAYCQSHQIKKETEATSKSTIPYWIVLAIIIAIVGAYLLLAANQTPIKPPSTKTRSNIDSNIKNILPSTIKTSTISQIRFTPWLSKKIYQSRFNNGYYKDNALYPAYVELDNQGNRRVVEIAYEPRFYWSVTSGRLAKEFNKLHIKHTMNGKKLLSMSIKTKQGVSLYTGTWISSSQIERESKKLKALGIYPPYLDPQTNINFAASISNTKMLVHLITADSKDAATKGRIFISINSKKEQSYLLDKPKYQDHALGATDNYSINIENSIKNIQNIKLSIEGKDAWKMEQLSIQFIQDDAYSTHYVLNANKWFSQEEYDINKLGAIPSYTFNLNGKMYHKEDAPTLYLPTL